MMIAPLALLLAATLQETGLFEGPGRACLKHSYIDLAEGEALKIEGAGTESAHFTLQTSRGPLRLIESEIIGDGGRRGRAVRDDGTTRVFRKGSGYRFYGQTSYHPEEDRLTLVLTGLRAEQAAAKNSLLHRIHVAEAPPASCSHGYRYGWDLISESMNQ